MVVASARTFGYVWKRVLGFHSVPVSEWISTKFDMGGPLADVINCDDFLLIVSGVLILWGDLPIT